MDSFTVEQRSSCMSKIRSKHTKPELLLRKFLTNQNIKYRLHKSELPGKPDIVIPKSKTAIFVNGCFWHQHDNCKRSVTPKSNYDYWGPKLERNRARQKLVINELERIGWNTLIIWECEVSDDKKITSKLRRYIR